MRVFLSFQLLAENFVITSDSWMMEKLKWILFSAALYCYTCEGLKILQIFPLPSKSHEILGDAVLRHLLDAGHEVTYITPFLKRNPHPNLRQIDVSSNLELFNETILDIKAIINKQFDLSNVDLLHNMMIDIAIATLENKNVMNLLRSTKENYDVIVIEWMFNEIYTSFAAVYQCPYIWFSTLEPHWLILSLIDEPLHPAYNPNYDDNFQPPLSFSQRVFTLYKQIEGLLLNDFRFYHREEAAYSRLIVPILKQKGLPIPNYQELKYNASLVLGNSHVSMGSAPKLPQNYKNVGGFHIKERVSPLPEDLKKIMDNAKNGVIYFSMGSNVKSKDFTTEMKKGLLNVFRGLKQNVIWKFEETLTDLPKNVHIVQWAPQTSILAHPNCVLFVTHGGLLSITEAIHYAVPVVAIPVFSDQFMNADRVVHKGFGVKLELSYTMHEELGDAIKEVLNNPKYTEKVKELSFIYHDRPASPGKELVHWIQHVARTRGAPHLRSPALHVPLYQKLYLDLLAVIIIAILIIQTVLRRLLCTKNIKISDSKKKLS